MKKLLLLIVVQVSTLAYTCQDIIPAPATIKNSTVPQPYVFCTKKLMPVGLEVNGRLFHFTGLPFNSYWTIGDLGLISNGTPTNYTKIKFQFSGSYSGNVPLYYIVRTDGKYLSFQIQHTAFLEKFSDTSQKYQKWQVAMEGDRYQIYNTLAATTPYFLRVFEDTPGNLYLAKTSCEYAALQAPGFRLIEDFNSSMPPVTQ